MRWGRIQSAVALGACVTVASCDVPAKRDFTLADADRLRLLFHPVLAPDESQIAFNLDDTLWIAQRGAARGRWSSRRPVATGLSIVNNAQYPFAAWSPDGQRFLFQAAPSQYQVTRSLFAPLFLLHVGQNDSIVRLFPDSIAARVRPVHVASLGAPFRARFGGPVWSPDGKRIAFAGFPAVEDRLQPVQVFVYDLDTGDLTQLTDGSSRTSGLAWADSAVLVARWDATGSQILSFDVGGGAGDTLLAGDGPYFDLVPSHDGQWIVARSAGRGTLLYRIDRAAMHLVDSIDNGTPVGWTGQDSHVLILSPQGMSNTMAAWNPWTGVVTRLTGPDTVYQAVMNEGSTIAYTAETGDLHPDLWTADFAPERESLSNRQRVVRANPWLDSVSLATAQVFRWTTVVGDTLEAQLFLPRRARDGTPPLLVIPYGAFMNTFPSALDVVTRGIEVVAARGWAVVRPNTRGIASEAQSEGYGRLQLDDTHRLLDALGRTGLVDTSRVALFGHSHGATMVYYYLTHSDRFDGGVAFNGAADWVYQGRQSLMAGIPGGMGATPDEAPGLYAAASPFANAERMDVPLLAIVGSNDGQIHPLHGRTMVDTLRALGKTADLLEFEDESHWIRNPENQRIMWERILAFLAGLLRSSAESGVAAR